MTRQLSRKQASMLGAVVLVGIGVAAWVLWGIDQRRGLGSDAIALEAAFADIAGVQVGTRVRIQGIDAGEVEAIVAPTNPGDDVTLRLRLSGKLRHLVTTDARVQIGSDNLLAGKVVHILPGQAPEVVEDGARLAAAPSADVIANVTQASARFSAVLAEMDATLQEFRKGQGTVGAMSQDLAQASARLSKLLARADTMLAEVQKGKGSLGLLLKDEALYRELTGTLGETRAALGEIRQSQGTLAKLVKNDEMYAETLQSLQDVRRMVSSVKQNADAIKSLPVVRSYVVDAHKELVRPDCRRYRRWYPASDLFEPDRAVLTDSGRRRLDEGATWLKGHKEAGAQVLIAAYAAPEQNGDVAQTLTQKQSEAVCEYLRNSHNVHRTGFWWWSTRPVKPLGVGNNPPALGESEKLPPARVELLVFVPGA